MWTYYHEKFIYIFMGNRTEETINIKKKQNLEKNISGKKIKAKTKQKTEIEKGI